MPRVRKTNEYLVYYGPHSCQKCDPKGLKNTLIVKAGNGAPDYLEYDFPKKSPKGKHDENIPWPYPNNKIGKNLKWVRHKCIKFGKKKI